MMHESAGRRPYRAGDFVIRKNEAICRRVVGKFFFLMLFTFLLRAAGGLERGELLESQVKFAREAMVVQA